MVPQSQANKVSSFFDVLAKKIGKNKISIVLVTHIIPDRSLFLEALKKISKIAFIIPKPKSIHKETFDVLKKKYRLISFHRNSSEYKTKLLPELKKLRGDYLLVDMGGYFAPILEGISKIKSPRLLGVIEDTENGHQKYDRLKILPCPVFSVARSPLKNPEDYLVGQSVVFSTDYVLRMNNAILNNNTIGVIGYGKLGRSIANSLYLKNLNILVYDNDPIKRVEAISHGFESPSKNVLLRRADIVFCATGNRSLTKHDFQRIKSGCFVASVTSSDDELNLSDMKSTYKISEINEHTDIYKNNKNYFYLLNKGNAINFLHSAVVGSFIYLVQAEMLVLIQKIKHADTQNDIQELDQENRRKIATEWLKVFTD